MPDRIISHDEAREAVRNLDGTFLDTASARCLFDYIAQQRAATSVRVVRTLMAGQSIAIVEDVKPNPIADPYSTLPEPTCALCGDSPNVGDGSWRWAGKNWQHRCRGTDAQAGHWDVPNPST